MNLYKINETLQHSYYQMPQELFCNEKYKKLSIEAKVIYAFLLNRMNLSRMNKWINDRGEIYLIYTRKEIQSKLNLSDKPVTRAFKELRETNLIKEEKQGFGKPNLIYIGKIEHEELPINDIDTDNYTKLDNILADNRIKEDYYVGEDTIQETEYLRANKKDNIKHKNYLERKKTNRKLRTKILKEKEDYELQYLRHLQWQHAIEMSKKYLI